MLYDISPEQKEKIEEIEAKYSAEVYHVIHGNYALPAGDIASMDTYLYVSSSPEEWNEDREDLKAGYQYAHVENLTDPYLSEIGMIGLSPANGGLHRDDRGYNFDAMTLSPEELADKLDQFTYELNQYEYPYDTRSEGRMQMLSDIQSDESLTSIKKSLSETAEKTDDQKTITAAKDLLEDISRFEENQGLSESTEQQQTNEHSFNLS